MTNVVAVYVGQASQTNLVVGVEKGVWGFKRNQDDYARIAPGDVVLLASGFSGGSPRVQLEEWLDGEVDSIEVGIVTSSTFESAEPVWPDEQPPEISYPFRFRFESAGRIGPLSLGSAGVLGEAVADALRRSAIAQGRAYVLPDPDGYKLEISTSPGQDEHVQASVAEESSTLTPIAEVVSAFENELTAAGLIVSDNLALRFLVGLIAKPFVILTGLSGSGKTQLASALGRWLGADRTHVSAVRPDWTGAEALFGYENLLLPAVDGRPAWSVPSELRFMLKAADDASEPYLLLLDEMNLAQVERYFADVLSGMESGADVLPNLAQDPDGIWRAVKDGPARLPFPSNLLVVGTVNVDETTYQFSPKVLDRSTSLEFRVQTESLAATRPQMSAISPATSGQRRALIATQTSTDDVTADLQKRIEDLHRLLAGHGREFGHRTFQEMLRFALLAGMAGPELDDEALLDYLVAQKVLPRVHGSSRELSQFLDDLRRFIDPDDGTGSGRLSISADKLSRMQAELDATHFTAF